MLDDSIITKDDEELVDDVLADVKSRFSVSENDKLSISFKKFFLLKDYSKLTPYKTVTVQSSIDTCYLSFVKVQYNYTPGRHSTGIADELQAYVFVKLPKNFGHTIIKRETVMNKIMELFQPLETDFEEDKSFSRKFYVLAKDKDKGRQLISQRFRDEVKRIDKADPYIECLNDLLLVSNKKGIADDSLFDLIEFGKRVSELTPYY
jgi:hypothetical protein